ncbi:hypothetical protein [Moraxella catarrhalis]|uniref:hypothetical protein n=1 Tax=Moraxella catarrhalis TaxID=480 RepID=UPI0011C3FFB9|nr:hypothetical protein [Moraxella catarrhalis]
MNKYINIYIIISLPLSVEVVIYLWKLSPLPVPKAAYLKACCPSIYISISKMKSKKVLLIDTDKQQSSFDFLSELGEEDMSTAYTEKEVKEVIAQAKNMAMIMLLLMLHQPSPH